MTRRRRSKLAIPIVMGTITVSLSLALIVIWTFVIYENWGVPQEVTQNVWLLVIGIASLVAIITVLVLLSTFLVREILEVRRQDSFIDSVTHELKSPLASIKLCLETLHRNGLSSAHRLQLHAMMADDIDRLASFIDDILEASRLRFGRRSHDWSEIALAPLIDSVVLGVSQRHKLPAGTIRVEMPAGIALHTDRTALETVLRNLLDNAVKYSEEPADVRMRVHELSSERLCVEVSDKGIGIPRAHLGRVQERFYRVPSEVVRARKGTGIGLFVVTSLVRSLGGRFDLRSAGAGLGTTAQVILRRRPAVQGGP